MYVGPIEMELRHMEGRQVSRSGHSLMTSISGRESQIDLCFGGKHRLVIINQQPNFIKIEAGHVNS